MAARATEPAPGVEICGPLALNDGEFGAGELRLQLGHDCVRDIVLKIGGLRAVNGEAVRPQLSAGVDVDQLDRDAHL
jgi:hypothetical protein